MSFMVRSPSLVAAQQEHDKDRADRRVVLRLSKEELAKVRRLKRRNETPAAFFRRLLDEEE